VVEKHVYGPFAHRAGPSLRRADLEFYGINHFRPSYVANVYFNDPDVDQATDSPDRATFAGRFTIFGHETCLGDEGHCEVDHERPRRFDTRPTHPLTRAFKRVRVTEALRGALDADTLTVTVIATTHPGAATDFDGPLLDLEGMQLATFD
jgi:hypothetical protein